MNNPAGKPITQPPTYTPLETDPTGPIDPARVKIDDKESFQVSRKRVFQGRF